MMKIETTMTLAQVVDADPTLARELERRGLDYCCGGARTLAESCEGRGLDPAQVVAELSASGDTGDFKAVWTTMTATELVDHLESTHHRYLWEELPRVSQLVDKILTVHGDRHPELADVKDCYAEIRADLEPHLRKEERVLFPMIRELDAASTAPTFHCGTLGNPIGVMLREHDAVGDLLARLRAATNGHRVPDDGCASFAACYAAFEQLEADTHLHIHKENNVLFPLVVALEDERTASTG